MPTSEPKRRSNRLSPDRFVVSMLLLIGLWLSDRFQWFGFNHHKGWTVLIVVAVVGVAAVVMLVWWIAALTSPWRFQFGIRSLLAFGLAASIAAGWLAVEMQQAKEQVQAVQNLRRVGGAIAYDWQVNQIGQFRPNAQPLGLAWLRQMLGADFFSSATYATINLPVQRSRPQSHATAGLEYLSGMPQLQCLTINTAKLTTAEIQHLKGLKQLTELKLANVTIPDDGLEGIGELTQLQRLDFFGTDVSDSGLAHLQKLTRLQSLKLYDTQVTDVGMAYLKDMKDIQFLDLQWTTIGDAGLRRLGRLIDLQSLEISNTNVTDAGVKKLQQALPNCKINH